MALTLGDRVLDAGLDVLRTEADQIWLLSASPTDYAAASAAKLGTATATFGTITDASGSRRIANPAITGGTVTAVGVASHWAAVDTVNSRLLATDALSGGTTTSLSMAWTLGGIAVLRTDALNPPPPPLADGQAYVNQQRGLFIHYNMATYGGADFISATTPNNTFNPTALDVGQWIDVAVQLGAHYAVLTVKHVDGFCLWPTTTTLHNIANTSWYAANGSPDITQMFVDECRANGILPCFYFSNDDRNYTAVNPSYTTTTYRDFQEAQMRELFDRYGPIAAVWLDSTWWYMGSWFPWNTSAERNARIKALQPGIIVVDNNHTATLADTDVVEWEGQGVPGANTDRAESCFSLVDRWFWDSDSQPMMTASAVVSQIKYANARNATLLLNIPPNTTGIIPAQCIQQAFAIRALMDEVPRVSPNNMTSNSLPSPYVASASSEYSAGYEAYRCFNSSLSTFWAGSGALPQWVQIDLGSSQAATKYMIQARQDNVTHQFLAWTLEGSNNGSTWTSADSRSKSAGAAGEAYFYTMTTPGTYRYWRWTITSTSSGATADCANIALFA